MADNLSRSVGEGDTDWKTNQSRSEESSNRLKLRIRILASVGLLISPIVFYLFSSGAWVSPNVGYADEWIYIGYALNLANPEFLPDNYKLSRMPWLVILWLVYTAFSPSIAATVIALASLAALGVAFYWLASKFTSSKNAGVIALFVQFYAYNHASPGMWTYHNTLASPLYLVTVWLIYRSLQGDGKGGLGFGVAAGASSAALVITAASYIFILPITFCVLAITIGFEQILKSVVAWLVWVFTKGISCVIGGVVGIAVFGFVSMSLGRPFTYWEAQFGTAKKLAAEDQTRKWQADINLENFASFPFLYLPLIIFVFSIFWMARKMVRHRFQDLSKRERLRISVVGIFCISALTWLGLHLAGYFFLSWPFYVAPIMMPALLALCAILPENADRCETRPDHSTILMILCVWLFFAVPMIFAASIWEAPIDWIFSMRQGNDEYLAAFGDFWLASYVFILPVLVISIFLIVRQNNSNAQFAGFFLLGLGNSLIIPAPNLYQLRGADNLPEIASNHVHELRRRVFELKSSAGNRGPIRIWGDPSDFPTPEKLLPPTPYRAFMLKSGQITLNDGPSKTSPGVLASRDFGLNLAFVCGLLNFAPRLDYPKGEITPLASRPVEKFDLEELKYLEIHDIGLFAISTQQGRINEILSRSKLAGVSPTVFHSSYFDVGSTRYYVWYCTFKNQAFDDTIAIEQ